MQGFLNEVFPSVQGEGYFVGAMQLFIRLAGCNLKCRGCDTSGSRTPGPHFKLLQWPGNRQTQFDNPIEVDALIDLLGREFPLSSFHSISFTGGEPLAQASFVAEAGRRLKAQGAHIFLETNGTLAKEAEEILDVIDIWSMDLKLSRSWALPQRTTRKHRGFLALLPPEKTYLKLVLDSEDTPEQILADLTGLDTAPFALVLQPYTGVPSSLKDWDSRAILEWIKLLQPFFREIRWVPQVHKLLRIP